MAERAPLLSLQALDSGDWGNRLRVSVQDEPAGVVPRTTVSSVIDANHIRLASAAGVEAGTILEVFNPADGATVGDLLKVTDVNRAANFTITLDGAGISVAQSAPGLAVRSREFRLSVYLFRQPDPAMPSRNETILDSEVFRYLSMDPRHSRYVQDIIGDINGALRLSDRRPEGESRYIRVSDTESEHRTSVSAPKLWWMSCRMAAGVRRAMLWATSCAAPIPSERSLKTIMSVRTIRTRRPAPDSTACAISRRSASSPVPDGRRR